MNVAAIKYCDIANGIGVRTSLFVSGCTHRCPGCFNEEAWDFNFGYPFTPAVADDILKSLAPDYIAGLSVLGGEPLDPLNQMALADFLKTVSTAFPAKDVWCYTGYIYDRDLVPGGRAYGLATSDLLNCIDVLVDGPFIQAQADITLHFRGSANQRILELKKYSDM